MLSGMIHNQKSHFISHGNTQT